MGLGFMGPQGVGMEWESFPHHARETGMGQDKTMWGGDEDPILRPRPTPLPSLCTVISSIEIVDVTNS